MGQTAEKNGEEARNHHPRAYPSRYSARVVSASAERGKKMTVAEEVELPRPLRDLNIAYEQGAAGERQSRDALVAGWRDWLHYGLQSPGSVNLIQSIQEVMDAMDTFLNHAGGRRK
jgi:hypothetical protein